MKLTHGVRSKRGYNCDFDNSSLQIKIKQKLIPVKNRQIQKHKWDRQQINQEEKINKYQENLQSKLQEMEEETDINQDWQNLKQAMLEAVTELKLSKDVKMLTAGGTMNVREQYKERMKQEEMSNKKNKNKLGHLSTKTNKS